MELGVGQEKIPLVELQQFAGSVESRRRDEREASSGEEDVPVRRELADEVVDGLGPVEIVGVVDHQADLARCGRDHEFDDRLQLVDGVGSEVLVEDRCTGTRERIEQSVPVPIHRRTGVPHVD
ncbi:MAG: hypothetical protein AAGG08_06465, partial [Actinomycetota bacterium]